MVVVHSSPNRRGRYRIHARCNSSLVRPPSVVLTELVPSRWNLHVPPQPRNKKCGEDGRPQPLAWGVEKRGLLMLETGTPPGV